ncbi:MAG: helicase C-terminal domain-containing protein [archaeon]
MSGTILNKKMFSFINGLDPKLTTFKSINSPFLIKKRPIYYIKTGKMTYNEKEETFKKQKKFINKIINKNKGKKGIIHTTTYEFSNWIQNSINNSRLIFHENTDREERLSEHLSNKRTDSVIVSPSMHTGIDLKDDLSRFQIIMKIPYPNISSNKIKQRQKTNKEWYNWKTVVDLIQGLGRSVRSENDYAESYVLDSSFSSVLMYNSHLIPNYITDAIKEIKLK